MKPLLLWMLVAILILNASCAPATDNTTLHSSPVPEGEYYLDIPESNWTSTAQVESGSATFTLEVVRIDADHLSLAGTLNYAGRVVPVTIAGQLRRSRIHADDLVAEPDATTGISPVYVTLRSSASKTKFAINPALEGQDAFVMYLFDADRRDLAMFEAPLEVTGLTGKDLSRLAAVVLAKTQTGDLWRSRIVRPTLRQ